MIIATLPTTYTPIPCKETAISSTRPNGQLVQCTVLHPDMANPDAELAIGVCDDVNADKWPGWAVLNVQEARALRSLLNRPEVAALLGDVA